MDDTINNNNNNLNGNNDNDERMAESTDLINTSNVPRLEQQQQQRGDEVIISSENNHHQDEDDDDDDDEKIEYLLANSIMEGHENENQNQPPIVQATIIPTTPPRNNSNNNGFSVEPVFVVATHVNPSSTSPSPPLFPPPPPPQQQQQQRFVSNNTRRRISVAEMGRTTSSHASQTNNVNPPPCRCSSPSCRSAQQQEHQQAFITTSVGDTPIQQVIVDNEHHSLGFTPQLSLDDSLSDPTDNNNNSNSLHQHDENSLFFHSSPPPTASNTLIHHVSIDDEQDGLIIMNDLDRANAHAAAAAAQEQQQHQHYKRHITQIRRRDVRVLAICLSSLCCCCMPIIIGFGYFILQSKHQQKFVPSPPLLQPFVNYTTTTPPPPPLEPDFVACTMCQGTALSPDQTIDDILHQQFQRLPNASQPVMLFNNNTETDLFDALPFTTTCGNVMKHYLSLNQTHCFRARNDLERHALECQCTLDPHQPLRQEPLPQERLSFCSLCPDATLPTRPNLPSLAASNDNQTCLELDQTIRANFITSQCIANQNAIQRNAHYCGCKGALPVCAISTGLPTFSNDNFFNNKVNGSRTAVAVGRTSSLSSQQQRFHRPQEGECRFLMTRYFQQSFWQDSFLNCDCYSFCNQELFHCHYEPWQAGDNQQRNNQSMVSQGSVLTSICSGDLVMGCLRDDIDENAISSPPGAAVVSSAPSTTTTTMVVFAVTLGVTILIQLF